MFSIMPDLVDATWTKSSYSESDNASCVEVAAVPGWVGVRDSKRHGVGPVLSFNRPAWSTFLTELR
jgi:hypothetical protein